jgi:trans-aconitate 2-methyltransferase
MADWNPGIYARFGGLRLRPALDLLAQVPDLPKGGVVDLGCGNGPVGAALKARFSGRDLTGIDNSPAMLEKARATGAYDRVREVDALDWRPETRPALIFSNALCHWLPDHGALFARLAGMLVPGGVLAVQMPRQYLAPSHVLLREVAVDLFPDRFDFTGWCPPVAAPGDYARMLAGAGQAGVWETSYIQRLEGVETGHPVHNFTRSTALRPFVAKLDPGEQERFVETYIRRLERAYPAGSDGSVLFPFKRVFFVLETKG